MALLPGSPAIDAGNNSLIPAGITTDQRGFARIVNGTVDIGAFESSGFTITVDSGSGQSTVVNTAFSDDLVVTVTANSPDEPVAGSVVTFTPPPSGASATIEGSPATIVASGGHHGSGGRGHGFPSGTASVTATANDIVGSYTVTASTAGAATPADFALTNIGATIYVLDTSASGALTMAGNATINLDGDVVVDSNSSSAIKASGNAQVTAAAVLVVGGVSKSGNAHVSKTGTPGSTGDPLSGLIAPTYSGTPVSVVLGGNSSATISQGAYSQITLSGNAKLTLGPGVYAIEDGGFSVSGTATVSGAGVMIYNTKSSGGTYGAINLSGNGAVSLTPLSSGSDAGILIFQDRHNTQTLTFSGNGLQGTTGTIYAQAAQLVESGNAQIGSTSNPVSIVVDTMNLSGTATADISKPAAPTGMTASPAIGPLGSASAGTLPTPVQVRAAIRRAPACFALSPTFQGASRSLVTNGAKTVSSALPSKAGFSVL
jgi:hypothetical protein